MGQTVATITYPMTKDTAPCPAFATRRRPMIAGRSWQTRRIGRRGQVRHDELKRREAPLEMLPIGRHQGRGHAQRVDADDEISQDTPPVEAYGPLATVAQAASGLAELLGPEDAKEMISPMP